jgi:hypothetical protein
MAQKNRPQQESLYGTPSPLANQTIPPILAQRAPTTSDLGYGPGQEWVDQVGQAVYILASVGGGVATWLPLATAPGVLTTLTGNSGGAISPTAGNINLLGTANQITTTGSGSTITWALPSAIVAPGSLTTTTSLTATLGNITATNGNLVLGTAGNKLNITTGSNASIGTSAAMTSGSITISTTAVTASSIIFLTVNTPGGTQGVLSAPVASIVAATHFVINSSNSSDTSTVNWWIVN